MNHRNHAVIPSEVEGSLKANQRGGMPRQARHDKPKARRHSHNRLPDAVVARMFADYQRTGSLIQAAALHGRSPTTLNGLFIRRGLKPKRLSRGMRAIAQQAAGRKRRSTLDDQVT